jgi:DNA-binding transcriptional ArsR family regulator
VVNTASVKKAPIDTTISALADPTRRSIVELLAAAPMTATQIHDAFPIANPAVSRHLRVLRDAGLIAERPVPEDRRVRLYELAPGALDELGAWATAMSESWQSQLAAFKDYVAVRKAR